MIDPMLGCGIYLIWNKLRNCGYVGQTIVSFKVRWQHHKRELQRGCHHNDLLQNAWNKYCAKAFVFKILEACPPDVIVCDDREKHHIADLKTLVMFGGYNLTNGGNNGKHSEETKRKISLAHIGKPRTDETRRKIGLAKIGDKNPNYGRTGEKSSRAKLTSEQAKQLRWEYSNTRYTMRDLAIKYGISARRVCSIINYNSYA